MTGPLDGEIAREWAEWERVVIANLKRGRWPDIEAPEFPNDDELPGMWSRSDFTGGPEEVRP